MNEIVNAIVGLFLFALLKGAPLTVYGDGQQTRSFQYVSDLVRFEQLLQCKFSI